MGIFKIRQLLALVVAFLFVAFLVTKLMDHPTTNSLGKIDYQNEFGGSGTYYTNKGLEVQTVGVNFFNITALQSTMDSEAFSGTLNLLRQFTSVQCHLETCTPVIGNVQQYGAITTFTIFMNNNERLYKATLTFPNQYTPNLSYEVDNDTQAY